MRSIFIAGLCMLLTATASAQLIINPGSQLILADNSYVELQNTDLVNNGNIASLGSSKFLFTGSNSSNINSTSTINFSDIEIKKTSNSSVLLQKNIGVTGHVIFTTGFLNLNGFDANLGSTGSLVGEQENSRVTATNGGGVLFSTSLNAPNAVNPGNLGAIITSAQNLGLVNIKRGHQQQSVNAGSNSILRYYDISPANNTSLNATLRLNYFDAELNAASESILGLFKSDNGTTWSDNSFTSKSTVTNFVEKSGLNNLTHFTLANSGLPLPVNFSWLDIKCESRGVLISWSTAQEQNSSHFEIQKSVDGVNWSALGSIPAAGNSNSAKSYSFKSSSPDQNSFYRILEYDINGRTQLSSVLRSSCAAPGLFSIWPNPARDYIYINLTGSVSGKILVKIFDSKGGLVKQENLDALAGTYQFKLDVRSLPKATYQLSVEWNNGASKKTAALLMQ